MKTFKPCFFSNILLGICLCVLGTGITLKANAQQFDFGRTETLQTPYKASDFVGKTFPVLAVRNVGSDEANKMISLGSNYNNYRKLKSAMALIKVRIDHSYSKIIDSPYTYKIFYKVKCFARADSLTKFVWKTDSLTISYSPDSLAKYQDVNINKYYGYNYMDSLVITDIKDPSNVTVNLSSNSFKKRLNFVIEPYFVTQVYYKKDGLGNNVCDPNRVLAITSTADTAHNYLDVWMNVSSSTLTGPPDVTPANYELEWTYVDDYGANKDTTKIPVNNLGYNFSHNATRVWLKTNYYRIPLIYERGYVVFRARMVRPDSVYYRDPTYTKWTVNIDSGAMSNLTATTHYYYLSAPHVNDKMNWQYTISFAEGGRYKHVLSYFDGLLKNRQTITRFNSNLSNLLVAENIYDFEGRPSIKLLPIPVAATSFRYQNGVSINANTTGPYRALDFDTICSTTCPTEYRPSPLAYNALGNLYYSTLNTDLASYQKYVPDAQGYPFVQTIYSPENDNRVDVQGGAGYTLQIGGDHETKNDYVGADQADLDQLMGLDAGWEGFYRKTVTRDPNHQVSMSVQDYKGRPVTSSMIGTGPNSITHAIVANTNVPSAAYFQQELIGSNVQQVNGFSKVLDKSFYMDVTGNDSTVYTYTFTPYVVPYCPSKALSVNAKYNYYIIDKCGKLVYNESDSLGFTGVQPGSAKITATHRDTAYLEMGKQTLHKELSIDINNIYAAADQFITEQTAVLGCLKSEPNFIQAEVWKKTFPCVPDYTDPCDKKKKEMIKDLYPYTGKYGNFYYQDSNRGIVNGDNSIFTKTESTPYRYQESCLVFPGDYVRSGVHYGDIHTMKPLDLMDIFNDTLAEMLLPLHPEYCRLMACFVDTFQERIQALPDGVTAQGQGLLLLNDIINADPLVNKLMGPPLNFTLKGAKDSLARLGRTNAYIDSLAFALAYCNCGDTVMYRRCMDKVFKTKIDSALLINDIVKNKYFSVMMPLYMANRDRYIDLMTANGDTCETCKLKRIKLVKPQPSFPTVFSAGGASNDSSSIWKLFSGSSASSTADALKKLMTLSQDSMIKYRDSAMASTGSSSTTLCSKQVDSIVAKLSNCIKGDATLLGKIRDTLNNLCSSGRVASGNYTPDQITYALKVNGVSLNDLCNPYVVGYDNVQPSTKPSAFMCKAPSYYAAVNSFLNRTQVISAFTNPGTVYTFLLSPGTNIFESNVKDTLRHGNDTIRVNAAYSSTDNQYTLFMYNGADSIRLYLKSLPSNTSGTCNSIFGSPSGATFQFPAVNCINDLTASIGDGYITNYSFTADLTRTQGATVTSCKMLAWTSRMEMLSPIENKISKCVPCTQMRSLYKQFNDTLSVYGIVGTDHPMHDVMLTSFMNYRLGNVYSTEQYLRFMQTCALADSMLLKQYVAYSSLRFSDSSYANTFITGYKAVDTSVTLLPPYMERDASSGATTILLDFNTIPKQVLWKYKDYVTNYTSTFLQAKLVNQPLIQMQTTDRLSTVIYPAVFYPTENGYAYNVGSDDGLFKTENSSTMDVGSATSVYVKVGKTWVSCNKYPIIKSSITPPTAAQISGGLNNAYQTMVISPSPYPNLPVMMFNNYQSTIPEDYYSSRQNFLRYVYSVQNSSVRAVLDSLSEDSLQAHLYAGQGPTYTIPSNPSNVANLYMSPTPHGFMDTLKHMFSRIAAVSPDGSIFLRDTATKLVAPGPMPYTLADVKAYRCADGSYLYISFDMNTVLFYAFVRMPKYIPLREHRNYVVTNVSPLPSGDNSPFFKLTLHNNVTGTNITLTDAKASFPVSNSLVMKDVLLGNPANGVAQAPIDTFDNCEKDRLLSAINIGKARYAHYVDSLRSDLRDSFSNYVMSHVGESLYLGYRDQRFNTTLYYYDRAGNLMRTVSPEGMKKLPTTIALKDVDSARARDTAVSAMYTFGLQQKSSVYQYNSRNALVYQKTPDGGAVNYYYDGAGRLAFSQNDKQRPTGSFTYNLYDDQGRVTETGEFTTGCAWFASRAMDHDTTINSCFCVDLYNKLLVGVPSSVYFSSSSVASNISYVHSFGNRHDVVLTTYDTAITSLSTAAAGMPDQDNLRKRVSTVRYYPVLTSDLPAALLNYSYATYYSYDIAGNVSTMVHDIPALNTPYGQRYKRIDYDYDLISGKVNLLSYNRSFIDQYYQKYEYDDDNRITKVMCSNDGMIWQRDAEYKYYKHGPLARMELGDNHVQGADYVYTIQGWLKAINADMQDTVRDIGGDGKRKNINAKDALALSLQYFQGDYASIGGAVVTPLAERNKDLFNGNISRQTIAMAPFANIVANYTYDQMNRIVGAAYDSINQANATIAPVESYRSTYSYDQDGNFKRLMRKGNVLNTKYVGGATAPLQMDTLRYFYNSVNNNKLKTIADNANDNYVIDIKKSTDSLTQKYNYDAIGNVTRDLIAGQDSIAWNLYNKVTLSQSNAANATTTFAYDGAGNRMSKMQEVRKDTLVTSIGDYYIRDAQGNILAVYHKVTNSKYIRRDILATARNYVLTLITPGQLIGTVWLPTYQGNNNFNNQITTITTAKPGFINPLLAGTAVTTFTSNSTTIQGEMLTNGTDYIQPMLGYLSGNVISAAWKATFLGALTPEIQQWTNGMYNHATTKATLIDNMCATSPGMINSLVTAYGLASLPDCHMNASNISTAATDMNVLAGNLSANYIANRVSFNSYLDALVQNAVMFTPEYTGAGGAMNAPIQAELLHWGNRTTINNFWTNWGSSAHTYLDAVTTVNERATVLYGVNKSTYINNYATYTGNTAFLDTVGAAMTDVTADQFMANYGAKVPPLNASYDPRAAFPWMGSGQVTTRDQLSLAEHDMYGSSRLGTRQYAGALYTYLLDNSTGTTVTTNTLTGRRPWYSNSYQDLINESSLLPWGGTHQSAITFNNMLGYKNYEITNHLGNVQAVVKDQRLAKAAVADSELYYRPVLQAAYDYYPFGMLMPARYVQDTGKAGCNTVTQTIDRLATAKDYKVFSPGVDGFRIAGDGSNTSGVNGAGLSVESAGGVSYLNVAGTTPLIGSLTDLVIDYTNTDYTIPISISSLTGTFSASIIMRNDTGVWVELASVAIPSAGTYNLNFNPSTPNVRLTLNNTQGTGSFARNAKLGLGTATYYPRYTTVTVSVCDVPGDAYRFGFNGKEKDNEIAGIGNFQDYGFREYDTRIARFNTRDPLAQKYPELTPYQFASNSPIQAIDLDGLERYIVTIDKAWKNGEQDITYSKIQLTHAGPLGGGVAVKLNSFGETRYFYGESVNTAEELTRYYEGNGLPNHPFERYNDSRGYATIGYGHFMSAADKVRWPLTASDKPFVVGSKIGEDEAMSLFKEKDYSGHKTMTLNSLKESLSGAQLDAMVDFGFNIKDAQHRIGAYNSAKGEKFYLEFMSGGPGLEKRRIAEAVLHKEGDYIKFDVIKGKKAKDVDEQVRQTGKASKTNEVN